VSDSVDDGQGSGGDDVAAGTEPADLVAGDAEIGRASVSRNAVHMLSSQAVTWTLATALAIVVPRLLGPFDQGQLRLSFSLWTIVMVFAGLGTGLHLNLEIARDRERGLRMVGTVLIVRTIAFFLATLGLGAYVLLSGADDQLVTIIAINGVGMLFNSWGTTFASSFYGLERMSVPAKATVLSKVVGTSIAIAVLFAGGNAPSLVAVVAFGNLMALTLLVRSFRRIAPVHFTGWRKLARPLIKRSVPFMASAAILTTYQQIDTVVIAALVDETPLGWYAAADALFGSLLFPATILASTVFPTLGRLHIHDRVELEDRVRKTFSVLMLAAVPLGLGTMVIGGEFAPLLFGEKFRESGEVLTVLGPVIVMTFGTILFGMVALSTERQWFWNWLMAVGVIMTVPLDLIFVPWADRVYDNAAIGGAMAYVVTEAMMLVIGGWKIVPFLFDRTSAWRWFRVLLAGGAMVATSWPLRERFIVLPIVVGVATYAVAIIALRILTDDERRLIKKLLRRLRIA
jgi:O-antigen/teichoic acid export membrane protein